MFLFFDFSNSNICELKDVNLTSREDDEICSEIRLLQKQLQDRLRSNNEKRLKFYDLAIRNMSEKRPELLKGAENRSVEQIYERRKVSISIIVIIIVKLIFI